MRTLPVASDWTVLLGPKVYQCLLSVDQPDNTTSSIEFFVPLKLLYQSVL